MHPNRLLRILPASIAPTVSVTTFVNYETVQAVAYLAFASYINNMEAKSLDLSSVHPTGVRIDQSQWPLLIVITPGKMTDEGLEDFLDSYSDIIKSQGERYALVLDVSNTQKLNPIQRKKLVNMMETNREFNKEHCAGCAMVFSSKILRGILTAIFWIHKPPHPTKVFTAQQEAINWAKSMV